MSAKSITSKDKWGPRTRFNWGYHDGHSDASRNAAREMVETASEATSPRPVARDFDYCYYAGYAAGLAETDYRNDSGPAWSNWLRGMLQDQRDRVRAEQYAVEYARAYDSMRSCYKASEIKSSPALLAKIDQRAMVNTSTAMHCSAYS